MNELSSSELTEWMAYDAIEPFGEMRADLRAGIVAATVANTSFNRPKKPRRAADFMPFARETASEETAPVLLPDPVAHGKLIAVTLFGGMNVQKAA